MSERSCAGLARALCGAAGGAVAGILIVEDEALIAMDLARQLERAGYSVTGIADNRDDAVALCREVTPALALLDICIRPPADGIQTAIDLLQCADIPVVFLTSYADDETIDRAAAVSPYGYLLKPFDERTLLATVRMALGRAALDRELRLLGAAVEVSEVGVALLDPDQSVRRENAAFSRLMGRAGAPAPLPAVPRVDPADPQAARIEAALLEGEHATAVVRSRAMDGGETWTRYSVSPVRDRVGFAAHRVLTCVDVTAARRAEETLAARERDLADLSSMQAQLVAQAEELRASVRHLEATQHELVQRERLASLGVLVAGVAHEVATPLGVVRTASDLLKEAVDELAGAVDPGDPTLPDAVAQFHTLLGLLRPNLDRAASMVRRFAEGAFDVERDVPHPLEVGRCVEEVVEGLRPTTRRCGLDVRVEIRRPSCVRASRGLVGQVLTNLVMNAIHHAYPQERGGALTILVDRDREGAIVAVTDFGVGMDPGRLAAAFERFLPSTGSGPTHGVGLFIARTVAVEQLGGTLEGRSEPGVGTTMTLRLPVVDAAGASMDGA